MAEVINFAAWKNAKRAGAAIAERDAARAVAVLEKKVDIAADLLAAGLVPDIAEAAFVASEMVEKAEAIKAARPMPAYCDPENEQRGAKYDAAKGLDVVEIAKRMRADIKALKLRAGFKVAVRISRFSGGRSIDIRVVALPAAFVIYQPAMASWLKQFPNYGGKAPLRDEAAFSAEYLDVLGKLKAIHGAYNRDNSDSMSDYFDMSYYGDAGFDWQVKSPVEKAEIAAARGDYWDADSAAM